MRSSPRPLRYALKAETAGRPGIHRTWPRGDRHPDAYAEELESFARCVRDGQPPKVTAYDALAAFDLALAADRSWRRGRAITVKPQHIGADVVYQVEPESR